MVGVQGRDKIASKQLSSDTQEIDLHLHRKHKHYVDFRGQCCHIIIFIIVSISIIISIISCPSLLLDSSPHPYTRNPKMLELNFQILSPKP